MAPSIGRRQRVDSVPQWFKLAKYEPLSRLSNRQLADELFRREMVQFLLRIPVEEDIAKLHADDLFENPVRTLDPEYLPRDVESDQRMTMLVREASIYEATTAATKATRHVSDTSSVLARFEASINTEGLDRLIVSVDLTGRDSELIHGFKRVIYTARKRYKIRPAKPGETIAKTRQKLVEYRIVPFLDLKIWEDIHRRKIERAALINAIWPDDAEMNAEKLKKSIARYAKLATSNAIIESLRHR